MIPLDGPAKHLTVGGRIIAGDIAVFEDKAANALLLDAENQIKAGYPTIATSSMVARRNKVTVPEDIDSQTDVRFFSELVKPMQYRWKFQKEKLKTISPSKHGFHQRSQSPTFHRLVEANEKLQGIVGSDDTEEVVNVNKEMTDFFETQTDLIPPLFVKPSEMFRATKSEPTFSTRTSYTSSLPATNDTPLLKNYEIKPEIRTIEPARKEKELKHVPEPVLEEPVSSEVATPEPPTPPPEPRKRQKEFKVDFKKVDSHAELHLFLPHIQEATNSRGATPEEKHRKNTKKLMLPAIDDLDVKSPEDEKSKSKKKHKHEIKKKKKHLNRIKSGKDDKQITDRLNDIPTWISLETNRDFHPESMCMFENCSMHKHKKSTRIRQA